MNATRVSDESRERGQVLVLTALFMVVLLLAAALAIDYSSWLSARRDYQSVADAAALAGSAQLPPPGFESVTSAQQQNAATDALVYLSEHLGWSIDRATAQSTTSQYLNQNAPYVVTVASHKYCVWIWTPTPVASTAAGTDPSCAPTAGVLYSPANYPGSSHKVFVRVQDARPSYFAGIAGINTELVSAIAVAGTAHTDWAVMALKPRLGSSDNVYGITINGGSTLTVPFGDVGGNYTLQWGGTNAHVSFPDGTLEQTVQLEEPQTVQGNGTVLVAGTPQAIPVNPTQLADYPIEDPGYFSPLPAWCTGPVTSDCKEDAAGTVSWQWPQDAGGLTTHGVYPLCATTNGANSDVAQHRISCADGSTLTIYPGKYETINPPNGVTITLSHNCYGDAADGILHPDHLLLKDDDCINHNRQGVFYFSSSSSSSGLRLQGTSGQPTVVNGCGVLLIFDPYETGGVRTQFLTSGVGVTLNLNSPAAGCNMKIDPGNLGGTTDYVWYGYNSPFQNPVSVWVRPNGNYAHGGSPITLTNGGSSVVNLQAGTQVNENGVIYAPQDNTTVSGGGSGSGVGQIVSWTIVYTGSSPITETFQGPGTIRSRLWQ